MATYTGKDKRLQYLFENGGGGGGTSVAPNPPVTPTSVLFRLGIDDDVYGLLGHMIEDEDGTHVPDRYHMRFVNVTSMTDDYYTTIVKVLPFKLTGNTTDGFLPIYGDEV